jgi:predicted RNA-binding protein YlxR (DUF448 family)
VKPNIRRCIVCRKTAPKSDLWRIVRVYPTQAIALDEGMGRSAYLCPTEECLKAAPKKNRLGKALKGSVPDHIYNELMYRLVNNCVAKDGLKR